jgi:hypothetical protein
MISNPPRMLPPHRGDRNLDRLRRLVRTRHPRVTAQMRAPRSARQPVDGRILCDPPRGKGVQKRPATAGRTVVDVDNRAEVREFLISRRAAIARAAGRF